MSELEITDILEDIALMKVFQEKIILIFPQHTLQEKSFIIWWYLLETHT